MSDAPVSLDCWHLIKWAINSNRTFETKNMKFVGQKVQEFLTKIFIATVVSKLTLHQYPEESGDLSPSMEVVWLLRTWKWFLFLSGSPRAWLSGNGHLGSVGWLYIFCLWFTWEKHLKSAKTVLKYHFFALNNLLAPEWELSSFSSFHFSSCFLT